MSIRTVQFAAIFLSMLALMPSAAHLMEFVGKSRLDSTTYLKVQKIYAGWALAGAIVLAALIAELGMVLKSAHQGTPFILALAGLAETAGTLLIFFVFIFPVNRASAQWTKRPADLDRLRRRWEYAHAASAVLALLAFASLLGSALSWSDGSC